MKKEELIKLGLTEEQAESVIAAQKEEIKAAEKSAREAAEAAVKEKLGTEHAAELKKLSDELDGLKAAASKSETDYAALKKRYDDDTAALRADRESLEKGYLIDTALTARSAKNLKACKALLDMEKITLKDGKLSGLDEQLDTVVKENGYMFGAAENIPQFMKSTQNPSGLDGSGKGLTYSQMMELKAKNPNAEI